MQNLTLFDDPAAPQGAKSFPTARPFHEELRKGARNRHRCQLVMAPTGAGKTWLGLNVIYQGLQKGKRAMFVCDRTTLIDQTCEVAANYGLTRYGVIQGGHPLYDLSEPFQIASVQTLARRSWPDVDIIVIDEAHTLYKTWTEHAKNTRASVIGLSATPFSKGLGDIFTNLVNAATMHALTEQGILVPMRVFSGKRIDMTGAETKGGEWSETAAAERGMAIIGDVVQEWARHAYGLKTIVFGATIAHCEEIAKQFNAAGIKAAVFTSHTPDDERKALRAEFDKPDSAIRVLVSVEALAKGFDVKDVGCVADCRPLRKSLSTAIQMWGRGLRSSPQTGKTECVLLDFSGNIVRFQDDYTDIFFNGLTELKTGEKLDKTVRKDEEKEGKPCPNCGHAPCGKRCTVCGHERQSRSMVEHEAGELAEIVIGNKKLASNKQDLWVQLANYVRERGNPEKRLARARALYKNLLGDWPPREWGIDNAPMQEVSRNTLNKLRSMQIAYANRRPA
jgi:DNA repair protein RadD